MLQSPSPALRPFIERLWWFESEALPHRQERILPNTHPQILVNLHDDRVRFWDGPSLQAEHALPGALISGMYARAFAVDTLGQRRMLGAVLRPGAAPALLRVAAHELADRHVALDSVWGGDAARLREQLSVQPSPQAALRAFDQALCRRIACQPTEPVQNALGQLERRRSVAQVAAALGLSQKRLRRLFLDHVGVTPKCYVRLARLQRLVRAANSGERVSWAQLALDAGYYDQAHMILEFRALTGLTPSKYAPRASDEPNHVVLSP